MNYQEICLQVKDLARRTGLFIKQEREKSGLNIEVKGKNDFVTQLDKAAEKKLITELLPLIPQAGFIAEEHSLDKQGGVYNWIIDPIDGTTNFIHGLPPHAISIALQEKEEIVVGVVYEMGRDECFYSWKGGRAFLDGETISVSSAGTVAEGLIATGFPYSNYALLDRFMQSLEYFMRNTHGVRRLGSAATDLAYVACGRFDAFYEYNLKAWDVAAGAFLVQQAGGSVADFSGTDNYLFGQEMVAGNKAIFNEFLTDVKRFMK